VPLVEYINTPFSLSSAPFEAIMRIADAVSDVVDPIPCFVQDSELVQKEQE